MLFLGAFEYAMDERGRVPIPPRYRDAFRDGIVLSQASPDRCLRLYTTAAFEQQAAQYTAESSLSRNGRDLRRAFFSRCMDLELDKQNRVLIPAHMREFAALSGKVLLIGSGEWFELWAPDAYATEMTRVDQDLPDTLESAKASVR